MTIFIEMNITTTFTSTQRHGAFVALFSVVIFTEILLFMIVGVVFVHMQIKYNNALDAKQHKVTRQLAIKDTEYEEILKNEKERQEDGPKARGINSSIVDDNDEDDQ